ncbi:hypothetical protein AVEN_109124-1 [Araneus ventricosus]|uniref:Uncharacterized protein n=1 Tax=Araneus ventricosus TaxID=182803 RepID=A0A4Y2JPS4_ARAVE|nr:hypothetical protein AVEN_109124-1 [Araneus ventricosus]
MRRVRDSNIHFARARLIINDSGRWDPSILTRYHSGRTDDDVREAEKEDVSPQNAWRRYLKGLLETGLFLVMRVEMKGFLQVHV